jgi:hypothetical protein
MRDSLFKQKLKDLEVSHTWSELLSAVRKTVLMYKIGDTQFESKTITRSTMLEGLINEDKLENGKTVTSEFVRMMNFVYKTDFKQMSQMFRRFLPKMTQEIMGKLYEYGKEWYQYNKHYNNMIKSSSGRTIFNEIQIYYKADGTKNKDRLAPMATYSYRDFANKLFRRKHLALWYYAKPDMPINGKEVIKLGMEQSHRSCFNFWIQDGKICFSVSPIIQKLSKELETATGCHRDYLKSLYDQALKIGEQQDEDLLEKGFI